MSYLSLFNSTRDVIRTDRMCREAGINVTVMPVPEKLSAECGMCLAFDDTDKERFSELVSQHNITTKIYEQHEV